MFNIWHGEPELATYSVSSTWFQEGFLKTSSQMFDDNFDTIWQSKAKQQDLTPTVTIDLKVSF